MQPKKEDQVEISNFRRSGGFEDVEFKPEDWSDLRLENILTRDFTVNSIMYDPRWVPPIHPPPPLVWFADPPAPLRSLILSWQSALFILASPDQDLHQQHLPLVPARARQCDNESRGNGGGCEAEIVSDMIL